jgi:hypothetical protein
LASIFFKIFQQLLKILFPKKVLTLPFLSPVKYSKIAIFYVTITSNI